MNYKTKLKGIKALVFDVDGVLTDGHVQLVPHGQPTRSFYNRDAFAIQAAVKAGLHVAIITGGSSEAVKERLEGLGVQDIFLKAYDKEDVMDEYMHRYGFQSSDIAYMGDDLPDLGVMGMIGLSCCPHDAAPEVREIADYISPINGGQGCARDIIEQTLKIQGHWNRPELRRW